MSISTLSTSNKWRVAISFLACTLLAVAAEWGHFQFVYGTTFSLASLFVLLSLRQFGLTGGLLTALITCIAGLAFSHHPLILALGLLEVLVTGLILRRYRGRLFRSNLIFWAVLGLPILYWLYLQQDLDGTIDISLVVCIFALNAIFNALFAEIIYHYLPVRRWSGLSTMNRQPVSISQLLRHLSLGIVISSFILNMLVNSAGSFKEVQLYVTNLVKMQTNMIKKEWGITESSQTRPRNAAQLRELQFIIDRYSYDSNTFSFVDHKQHVLASNHREMIGKKFEPLETGRYKHVDGSLYFSHKTDTRHPLLYTWHDEQFLYIEEMKDGTGSFVLTFPLRNYYPYLFGKYSIHFIYLVGFTGIALLISMLINRTFTKGFQRLLVSTRNLPVKLRQNNELHLPKSSIVEIHSLIQNFKHMSSSLLHMFLETQKINERLQAQTQLLQQSEERLHQIAYYDTLTGLPNRLQFNRQFLELIAMSVAAGKTIKIAVLIADINRFKQINDTLGHAQGDQLLTMTAERLQNLNNKTRSVFRLGGDEFVILTRYAEEAELEACAEAIRDCFSVPFILDEMPLYMTVSIGISMYPQDGEDMNTITRNADIAMYTAKDEGDGYFRYYKPNLLPLIAERMQLENGLHKALLENQLFLCYQPKISAATGELSGIEALIRWKHPELGLIPPDKFIPLAEESGFILEIDRWVFREACRQNKAWQDAGLQQVSVSVNISARHFYQGDLIEMIAEELQNTGLDARYISLEITEGVFMRNIEQVIEKIQYLRRLGIQISIDDFGTGFSSLNQLQRLPISDVKLDRSFIRGITHDDKKSSIVRAIIELAHSMNMRVVAEGVETGEESQFCKDLNCDELQGYLFSRPLPAEMFEEFLRG
ncbi:EAL domain-containing protein [Paenibacillus nanensis]|uniref:EAL domain-containing protein n=1 Tax=Paenibacillus nanensis TaxID=393251 RepID=A0A3A1UVN0_9BACL|nr:EAL domain-containing protein [Paenibacillus nanensis]RIX51232.1 EAL domain-containing protein [Paenibacillus nanensis]